MPERDATANIEEQHANLMARMIQLASTSFDPVISTGDRSDMRVKTLNIRLKAMSIMSLLTELQIHQIMAQLQLLDQCFRDKSALRWLLELKDQNEERGTGHDEGEIL